MTEWRTTPRAPGYLISDEGQVMGPRGKVLRPALCRGYPKVAICHRGEQRSISVHVLVCEAFHGPKPTPQHQVAHWDGDKTNNHASNLRWATAAENYADAVRHGTNSTGERHGATKLDWEDVREIRSLYAEGKWSQSDLAYIYGVERTTVRAVVNGTHWRVEESA